MQNKLLSLSDELSTDSAGPQSVQQSFTDFLASQPDSQTAAPQFAPADTTSGVTLALVAQSLAGQAYAAQYLDTVLISQTTFPFTQVDSFVNWEGSSASMRGSGIAYGFSDPRTSTSNPAVDTVTVFTYKGGTWNNIGSYDVVGYNSNDIVLGAGDYTAGEGYQAYLMIHNTTLQPGVTDQTFPTPLTNDSTVFPAHPPEDTAITAPVPCYLAGTRVATARGDVAVEDLHVGDMVRTVNGAAGLQPVVWIGQRSLSTVRHPEPTQVAPVRIRAGAFAEGLPVRDLLVSPDHAIFVDGALVPARLLINGGSIAQDLSVTSIRYFHVELDRHAVMLAEGLPAESYLPGANRAAFEGASAMELHPTFTTDQAAYAARACAPLVLDRAAVLPIWSRLAARGAGLGMSPRLPAATADAEFRVMAGKRILTPTVEGGRLVYKLPRATKSVRLVSRAARPADTRPWLDDRRMLGVMVAGLTVETGRRSMDVAMHDASLTEGWHAPEENESGVFRWTDGGATVAMPRGAKTLAIHVAGEMSYPVEALPLAA